MAGVEIYITGNDHARISTPAGRHVRYCGVIEPTQIGVRLTKREWPTAKEAVAYRDRVLARLTALRAVAVDAVNSDEDAELLAQTYYSDLETN